MYEFNYREFIINDCFDSVLATSFGAVISLKSAYASH